MAKCYLFTWEENYLLHKELLKWKEGFLTKHGEDTVMAVSLSTHTKDEILHAMFGSGLFSDTKLIIIYDIPGSTTSPGGTADLEDSIITHRSQLNDDYYYIFVSPKPDKRKKWYKYFSEHCEVKTFSPMDMRSIPKFVQSERESVLAEDKKNITLTRDHVDMIVERVGKSGRHLHHEIHKLAIAINTWLPLSPDTIKTIVAWHSESSAFEILDRMIDGWHTRIYAIIDQLISSWEVRQGIHGWLLWWLKQIIAFGLTASRGWDTKSLWLPPFVSGKYNKYQDTIISNIDIYREIYNNLLTIDYNIKNWSLHESSYRTQLKQSIYLLMK